MYPKKKLAQLVVAACQHYHIDTVVISPGSRNAPLTIGFHNHPNIKTLRVVDERCAAFFAMGIAQQQRKPVAIVCSSGSALLNYYPAIAEAYYSRIPLVVISADRPKRLIDIGDGQTIRQENVFQNHILYTANLTEKEDAESERKHLKVVQEALHIANNQQGPVHINVPFDEPLYEVVDVLEATQFEAVETLSKTITETDYTTYAKAWNTSTRKMILIGEHFPDEALQKVLEVYAEDTSVLIFTETTSNVYHSNFINSIDQLIFPLSEEEFKILQPEILITLGGMVVSKKIKQFLRKLQPQQHWHIDPLKAMDTYHCLTAFVQEIPVTFLGELSNLRGAVASDYQQHWLAQKVARAQKHKEYLASCPFSDLKAFEAILAQLPEHVQLQISNSSTIRYSQLFDVNPTLQVFCNRGTSGIDGSTSTAVGAAYASAKQTVFITGDLSFFYDSNALWNENIPKDFRIIILNNSGGGIFRFIPGPLSTNATEFFETPHELTAAQLSKMYNFDYVPISDLESLTTALPTFFREGEQPKIMEIFTPRTVNDKVLKAYFKNL